MTTLAPDLVALPASTGLEALPDDELLQRQSAFAAVRRRVEAGAVAVAAEIARRSARELGHDGLAAREGSRTPERLIERLAGVTPAQARAMVRVGDAPADSALGGAIADGSVSVSAADAIITGLGEPTDAVPAAVLDEAAALLVSVAPDLSPRRLVEEARALRDRLDVDGVPDREARQRAQRYARVFVRADGMTRIDALLSAEDAAIVTPAIGRMVGLRSGPRFTDPAMAAEAKARVDDDRTDDQLRADALVDLIRIGAAADSDRLYTQQQPAVIVHVRAEDLAADRGAAHIDGQTTAVSIATAKRFACAYGLTSVVFDGRTPLDVGRTRRLFTRRQRIALAARDGGCIVPECDMPASRTEAHHIVHWEWNGPTDLDHGVLLCRFHHLMVHNQDWLIQRVGDGYVAHPPPGSDRPVMDLHSKSRLRR